MAMLRICTAEGCATKTLSLYCIDHEGDKIGASEDINETLRSAIERNVQHAGPLPLDPRD
jgi:hypothetical protein